jgi:competence protein ComEA
VNSPGVYLLGPDARVLDAIAAAGGLSSGSSAATLNLAAPVRDGQKLVVPFALVNDGSGPQGVVGGTAAADGLEGISEPASPGLIDLNTASADELESLPGIGPVRAAAIIDFRSRNGGIVTTDDLLAVDGIGPATVASIRPLVLQP